MEDTFIIVILLIALFIDLCVGIWVFSDAKARKKSTGVALFWGIASFSCLILFLPLWLLTRPTKTDYVIFKDQPKLCVHCGKYYEGAPSYCPNCGNALRKNDQAPNRPNKVNDLKDDSNKRQLNAQEREQLNKIEEDWKKGLLSHEEYEQSKKQILTGTYWTL